MKAIRAQLARQRLELLRRETAHLADARRILKDIEASEGTDPKIVRAAGRSVELAAQAQTLGVVDAHRVGATSDEIARVTGMGPEEIARALGGDR